MEGVDLAALGFDAKDLKKYVPGAAGDPVDDPHDDGPREPPAVPASAPGKRIKK